MSQPVGADILEGALLLSPLLGGLVLHGVCIRFGLLARLATPIDHGASFRGRRLFGENKTYRGVVGVAVGTGLGFLVLGGLVHGGPFPHLGLLPSGVGAILLGAAVGAAAMLSELPNSAVKRQLGVHPGEQASGVRGMIFHVLDQVDVLVGAWLILAIVVWPTSGLLLGSLVYVYVGHQIITMAGYRFICEPRGDRSWARDVLIYLCGI